MELLPGADLEVLLRGGDTLLLQERLDVVIQVCRGLAYAHDHRIVHRDIKPSNIRILDDGTAKIMDFGIAKLQGTGVTKAGMMVGTVHYMSPEQVRGHALDGRSDVFSVGVILYELLSGCRPFPGDSATGILYKIIHEAPGPLPLQPDLGASQARLQEIVDHALAKDREHRFASATALGDALAEVLTAHTRVRAPALSSPMQETLQLSRRLLKEGRFDESVRRLQEVLERNPHSLEARRALRVATRELQRCEKPQAESEEYPELEATYQAPPTQLAPATGTVVVPSASSLPQTQARRPLFAVIGFACAVAIGSALVLMRGQGGGAGATGGQLRLPVRSQPTGASVLLDGQDTGVVTDGELSLPGSRTGQIVLTFRKAGRRDESRTVSLPLAKDESVSVILGVANVSLPVSSDPPGATVSLDGERLGGLTPLDVALDPTREHRLAASLDGYAAREVRIASGAPPSALRLTLEPSGPTFAVTLSSAYPLEVSWRGRVVARGQASPRILLPQGRQSLTLVAPSVFLRTSLNLDVKGETSVAAPGVGKLNIKASPDNCEVFVDGVSAGYLPILDKPVAVGTHSVTFRWPDGGRQQENVEVAPGRPAYVTGRKD
jgi:hypothetical protein